MSTPQMTDRSRKLTCILELTVITKFRFSDLTIGVARRNPSNHLRSMQGHLGKPLVELPDILSKTTIGSYFIRTPGPCEMLFKALCGTRYMLSRQIGDS
ncbi:hypothetical protein M378DRAFT_301688 [Amanita muscaria Koide BX008]|uniref:Uncharacterized protein n=1 Tax=Amanita muscaria (strain Koide BX008) TaxID=946122 RepID=A0A0C2WZR7_AMAMK|nr:hypothetical protein M378DRAFT_301688 [Amanita muscaria Koide BX008]